MAFRSPLIGPLNPFRITGTAMPPALLLMCKILALSILATGHVRILPEPFLPFIPFLDSLDPVVFRIILQAAVWTFALLLLFNQLVRIAALGLGGCMLLAVLSSSAYYGNNKTFVGLMLLLSGLSDFDRPPYLVRWQFSLVYFGAALNKLLDPDWQSGLFFDYWASEKIRDPLFLMVRDYLPSLMAGKLMCWGTILAEFAVAVLLFMPRWMPWALWINALFQMGLLEFTGGTFTLFFYAMQASALAFVAWPERVEVFYPSASRAVHGLRWLDFDRAHQWREVAGVERFRVNDNGKTFTGVCAVARLFLLSPAFWLTATFSLAILPPGASLARRVLVVVVFLAILPGFWCKKRP